MVGIMKKIVILWFLWVIITIICCTISINKTVSNSLFEAQDEILTYLKIHMPTGNGYRTDEWLIRDVHDIMLNLDGSLDDILYYMQK